MRLTGTRIYILWDTPMRHHKTACFGALFWNLILLNLTAASYYLHGKVLAAAGSESFMVRNLLQVLVRELNHFKQQRKALRQASQLCCFGVQMQFVTVSDVGPLETIAENKTEQKSAAKRRQRLLKAPQQPPS